MSYFVPSTSTTGFTVMIVIIMIMISLSCINASIFFMQLFPPSLHLSLYFIFFLKGLG